MADIFSKGITTLNVKTSTFLEVKKIQTYIAKLNSETELLEKKIGAAVYEAWENGEEISEQLVAEELAGIRQKKQVIEEQTRSAEELTRMEAEILVKSESPKQEKSFCPNCGQAYTPPAKFCRKCGTKLTE